MMQKSQLVVGMERLDTEVKLCGYDTEPSSDYGMLENNLRGAIKRRYGTGFLGLKDSDTIHPEVEEAYLALESIRDSDIVKKSSRMKKIQV